VGFLTRRVGQDNKADCRSNSLALWTMLVTVLSLLHPSHAVSPCSTYRLSDSKVCHNAFQHTPLVASPSDLIFWMGMIGSKRTVLVHLVFVFPYVRFYDIDHISLLLRNNYEARSVDYNSSGTVGWVCLQIASETGNFLLRCHGIVG